VDLQGLGWCKLYSESLDEVIPLVKQAIRLSPRDPDIGYRYHLIGMVHLLQSRTDEAIVWLKRGCSAMPTVPFHHSWLASAYALNGECATTIIVAGRIASPENVPEPSNVASSNLLLLPHRALPGSELLFPLFDIG
jgi:hypothetical protein